MKKVMERREGNRSIGANLYYWECLLCPRDLAPRAFSYLAGWKQAAFPDRNFGLLDYMLGPLLGGIIAAFFFTRIIQPVMTTKSLQPSCACNQEDI